VFPHHQQCQRRVLVQEQESAQDAKPEQPEHGQTRQAERGQQGGQRQQSLRQLVHGDERVRQAGHEQEDRQLPCCEPGLSQSDRSLLDHVGRLTLTCLL
jgi:hypothetical protein